METKAQSPDPNQNPAQAPLSEPEKELFSWKAPARPFKRRDRQFWVTVIAIAVVFGMISFLAEGVMPVIVIISVIFLYYVLSTVEPETVTFSITTWGVKIVDKLNPYGSLNRFWFTRRFNDMLLIFETATFPGRLEVIINPKDKEKIKTLLKKYLPEEEAPPSGLDKAANYFAQKLPGNQPQENAKK